MLKILEFLTNFYWLALPQAILESLWHADWRQARRRGAWGITSEAVQAIFLMNSVQFYVPNDGLWDMASIDTILRKARIPTFAIVFVHGEFSFRVPERHAWLAEKKLTDAGVPLSHDPRPLREQP